MDVKTTEDNAGSINGTLQIFVIFPLYVVKPTAFYYIHKISAECTRVELFYM